MRTEVGRAEHILWKIVRGWRWKVWNARRKGKTWRRSITQSGCVRADAQRLKDVGTEWVLVDVYFTESCSQSSCQRSNWLSEQNGQPDELKGATRIWGPLIKFKRFIEQLEQKSSSDKIWQVLGERKQRRRSEPHGSRVVCESVNCVTVSLTEAPQGRSPPVTLILEQHWARSFTKGLWPVRRRGENRWKKDRRWELVWSSESPGFPGFPSESLDPQESWCLEGGRMIFVLLTQWWSHCVEWFQIPVSFVCFHYIFCM